MSEPLRVSLTPALHRPEAATVPFQPLLQPAGPRGVISTTEQGGDLAVPVSPTPQTLFGQRGGCLFENGPMYVADTGYHRLLGWRQWPEADNTPTDWIFGQPGFFHEGRNAKGEVTAGRWLLVADTANSRLLGWHCDDYETGAAARRLTGQPDFHAKGDNRWQSPVRDSLCWPYGMAAGGGTALICDSGNNRIMLWHLAGEGRL